ncbi:hypothetical protein NITHO_5120010 [Nitrolancea hollandica Lb]|uniref:Uncharacterized protein n=1 Tax=Nitrolancea hollandica Lb TaxID=1129897 RepID=I4ELH7_9BACT|nr:hypothetical protein NITHO_5120010 [Nitrolancea hollandica Lb]
MHAVRRGASKAAFDQQYGVPITHETGVVAFEGEAARTNVSRWEVFTYPVDTFTRS